MTNVSGRDIPAAARALEQLRRHQLFAAMPEEDVNAVAAGAFESARQAGEYFFREGEPGRHYLLVTRGRVDMVRVGIDGQERVARFFSPGELVAEAAMFMAHGRYPMSARATEDSGAWCLLREPLREACLQYPPLALQLLESLSGRLYQTVNEVSSFALASASQRLAAYLMAQRRAQGALRIELPLATHQLAGHLGIRPETLSRIFSQWLQEGYVRGRGRVWELRDVQALGRLAEAVLGRGWQSAEFSVNRTQLP
jgi:CRP-like cAMP-binding protein